MMRAYKLLALLVAAVSLPFSTPPPLLTISLAATLLTFLFACLAGVILRSRLGTLASKINHGDKKTNKLESELEAQALLVRQMSLDLEELRKRLAVQDEPARAPAPVWAATDLPVNLNRRGQILRLSRKGKSALEIAQDLHIAQGEVELLLKVHDLSQSPGDPERL